MQWQTSKIHKFNVKQYLIFFLIVIICDYKTFRGCNNAYVNAYHNIIGIKDFYLNSYLLFSSKALEVEKSYTCVITYNVIDFMLVQFGVFK